MDVHGSNPAGPAGPVPPSKPKGFKGFMKSVRDFVSPPTTNVSAQLAQQRQTGIDTLNNNINDERNIMQCVAGRHGGREVAIYDPARMLQADNSLISNMTDQQISELNNAFDDIHAQAHSFKEIENTWNQGGSAIYGELCKNLRANLENFRKDNPDMKDLNNPDAIVAYAKTIPSVLQKFVSDKADLLGGG